MTPAVVVGGAKGWRDDLDALEALYGRPWDGLWIATNDTGAVLPTLDHWCTLHPEKIVGWKRERARRGYPPAPFWSFTHQFREGQDRVYRQTWIHGSSGLYAVGLALHLGCAPIVLCGVPMDTSPNAFRDEAQWKHCMGFRVTWTEARPKLGNVRSMSGWTRELLGAPTRDWLRSREAT